MGGGREEEGEGERERERVTYLVPHDRRAKQVDAGIVSPLDVVQLRTVQVIVSAIEDLIRRAHKPDGLDPVPHPVGPVEVGLIAGVHA